MYLRNLLVLSISLPATVAVLCANGTGQAGTKGDNSYFDTLVARPDHLKSFSLRDPAQLDHPKNGGFAYSNSLPLFVTYDAVGDAAKVRIPLFDADLAARNRLRLGLSMNTMDTTITLDDAALIAGDNRRLYKIDGEIMEQAAGTSGRSRVRPVLRAQRGTVAAPHAAGALVMAATNSLPNGLKIPLGLGEGHTYLITWDAWFDDAWRHQLSGLRGNKTFQITAGGDNVWLETKLNTPGGGVRGYDPAIHVGNILTRLYNTRQSAPAETNWSLTNGNTAGPNITTIDTLRPMAGAFLVRSRTWTRFWWLIEAVPNDWDRVSLWVADDTTDPVLLIDRLQASIRPPFTIDRFWLEFNDSQVPIGPNRTGDLNTLVRNLVVLRDVLNPAAVLVRPGG